MERESSIWFFIWNFLTGAVSQPRIAAAFCAIALAVGLTLGYQHAAWHRDNKAHQWETQYVDSINPFSMSHLVSYSK